MEGDFLHSKEKSGGILCGFRAFLTLSVRKKRLSGAAPGDFEQALRADRHAAGAYGPGNGIPPPQASKRQYPTRSAAQCDVFAYLESFYNTRRPYSALGWIPPSRFEAELCHSVA